MLARLKRFNRLIAESEARIAEQRTLIAKAEIEGRDTGPTRRALDVFEAALAEYRRARDVTEELRHMLGGTDREPRPYTSRRKC